MREMEKTGFFPVRFGVKVFSNHRGAAVFKAGRQYYRWCVGTINFNFFYFFNKLSRLFI